MLEAIVDSARRTTSLTVVGGWHIVVSEYIPDMVSISTSHVDPNMLEDVVDCARAITAAVREPTERAQFELLARELVNYRIIWH